MTNSLPMILPLAATDHGLETHPDELAEVLQLINQLSGGATRLAGILSRFDCIVQMSDLMELEKWNLEVSGDLHYMLQQLSRSHTAYTNHYYSSEGTGQRVKDKKAAMWTLRDYAVEEANADKQVVEARGSTGKGVDAFLDDLLDDVQVIRITPGSDCSCKCGEQVKAKVTPEEEAPAEEPTS